VKLHPYILIALLLLAPACTPATPTPEQRAANPPRALNAPPRATATPPSSTFTFDWSTGYTTATYTLPVTETLPDPPALHLYTKLIQDGKTIHATHITPGIVATSTVGTGPYASPVVVKYPHFLGIAQEWYKCELAGPGWTTIRCTDPHLAHDDQGYTTGDTIISAPYTYWGPIIFKGAQEP